MSDDKLDQLIKRASGQLDEQHPADFPDKEQLWDALNKKRSRTSGRRKRVWMAAAAVSIVTAFFIIQPSFQNVNTRSNNTIESDSVFSKEADALARIARLCSGEGKRCNTPELRDLRDELEESSAKLDEIEQQLKIYGDDHSLIRAKERVERHKARVIKTLVKIL